MKANCQQKPINKQAFWRRHFKFSFKRENTDDLSALMSRFKIGDMNWQCNQEWQLPFTPKCSQAVFAFKGDVYVGLDAYTLSEYKLVLLSKL